MPPSLLQAEALRVNSVWSKVTAKLTNDKVIWGQHCLVMQTLGRRCQRSRVDQPFHANDCRQELFICDVTWTQDSEYGSLSCFIYSFEQAAEVRHGWWAEAPLHMMCRCSCSDLFFINAVPQLLHLLLCTNKVGSVSDIT